MISRAVFFKVISENSTKRVPLANNVGEALCNAFLFKFKTHLTMQTSKILENFLPFRETWHLSQLLRNKHIKRADFEYKLNKHICQTKIKHILAPYTEVFMPCDAHISIFFTTVKQFIKPTFYTSISSKFLHIFLDFGILKILRTVLGNLLLC